MTDDSERKSLLSEDSHIELERGNSKDPTNIHQPKSTDAADIRLKAFDLLFCFVGLQVSYLTWGVMQELIMDSKFNPTPSVPSGMFPSPTFCVFSNRLVAIIAAAAICLYKDGTVFSSAPLLEFTPCAISNTISSWSQYASLEYVSFPLLNLFKSAKVIPVMLMGTILKGKSYPVVEYIEAAVITLGVVVFSFNKGSDSGDDRETKLIGLVILVIYIISDSFTSPWQNRIYEKFGKIDQFHMMFGVNSSAILITTAALIINSEIPTVIEFLAYNPKALTYNIVTAVTSATGQLFIYYTIKKFGAITFTVIMTTRQIFSMIISVILFGHNISAAAILGTVMVFAAVFHSIKRQMNGKGNPQAKS